MILTEQGVCKQQQSSANSQVSWNKTVPGLDSVLFHQYDLIDRNLAVFSAVERRCSNAYSSQQL